MNTESQIFKNKLPYSKLPEDAGNHKGMYACACLSSHILGIWMKIHKTASGEQLEKFAELENAYIAIVNDLSHVYRLEITTDQYQYQMIKLYQENEDLKRRIKVLTDTLNFE